MRPAGAALSVLVALLGSALDAQAHCSPPCGPVPPVVDILLQPTLELTFGSEDHLQIRGTVSYFVDVDFNGYYADPQHNPVLTLYAPRVPAWMKARLEPSSFTVPLNDPAYLRANGPDQVDFYWEAPVTLAVERTRDPTPQELSPASKQIRRDGTARVLVVATSTASFLAQDLLGPQVGIQEGYGMRELRFIPEKGGLRYLPDAQGVLRPAGDVPLGSEDAPGAPLAALFGLACAFALRRR